MTTLPDDVDWSSVELIREFDQQLDPVPISPVKRSVDLVVSGLLLLIFSPVFFLAWVWNGLANRLSGRDRKLFLRETRVNDRGQFDILKFCVLRPEVLSRAREESEVVHVKPLEREPDNHTWLGAVLLAVYLDELPQLWNVFVGDMSLVGPRPWPLPDYEGEQEKGLRRKILIRPGLTGPAQVSKGFPELYEGNYEGDYRYIHYHATHGELACFWYDLKLVLRTFYVLLRAEGN